MSVDGITPAEVKAVGKMLRLGAGLPASALKLLDAEEDTFAALALTEALVWVRAASKGLSPPEPPSSRAKPRGVGS